MDQFLGDLIKYFTYAQGFLSIASASGIVKPESAAQISTVMNDIEGVAKNANPPTAELATSTVQLLKDLSSDGVIPSGVALNETISGLGQFTAYVHDIQSGQSIVLNDHVKVFGVSCLLSLNPVSPVKSDQAASLGY